MLKQPLGRLPPLVDDELYLSEVDLSELGPVSSNNTDPAVTPAVMDHVVEQGLPLIQPPCTAVQ